MSGQDWKVLVIGAGTMGHGIAQVCAQAGCQVRLYDLDPASVEKGLDKVRQNLEGGIRRGKLQAADRDATLQRLEGTFDLAGAAREANLVVEAVVEKLEVKRELFSNIADSAPRGCILASNTSSLSIASIAQGLPDPSRVIGMHFFNPVHIMKLVEVVVHPGTSEATREAVLGLARLLGKEPILVQDSPGFASSRLGVVIGLEAMRMLEQGVASAQDIDQAMQLGYGHPMGPLRLSDLVGLDVRLAIADFLHSELHSEQYAAPQILRDKVARGELGKKSGQGFYDWSSTAE